MLLRTDDSFLPKSSVHSSLTREIEKTSQRSLPTPNDSVSTTSTSSSSSFAIELSVTTAFIIGFVIPFVGTLFVYILSKQKRIRKAGLWGGICIVLVILLCVLMYLKFSRNLANEKKNNQIVLKNEVKENEKSIEPDLSSTETTQTKSLSPENTLSQKEKISETSDESEVIDKESITQKVFI